MEVSAMNRLEKQYIWIRRGRSGQVGEREKEREAIYYL